MPLRFNVARTLIQYHETNRRVLKFPRLLWRAGLRAGDRGSDAGSNWHLAGREFVRRLQHLPRPGYYCS